MEMKSFEIKAQEGPQEDFLSIDCDFAIFGGAAGSGKSYGILLDPLRHVNSCPEASAVFFRRTLSQIRNSGGLWDEAKELYMNIGSVPRESPSMDLVFPHPTEAKKKGFRITFSSLQHEKDKYNFQGSQIPIIYFDELTHFSRSQVFYLIGRNRSTCGIKPYVRATTNPDASSWVRQFIDWWIDKDGLAIKERSGQIRWLCVFDDKDHWFDSKEKAIKSFPKMTPLSITFIPARLSDNKILMDKDPSYEGKLMSLSRVERDRLLGGNWDVKPSSGTFFKRHYFQEIPVCPPLIEIVRAWDRAGTEVSDDDISHPADWTVGVKMGKTFEGQFVIMDIERQRYSPGKVSALILNTARQDGPGTKVKGFQDPGSAGVYEKENFVKMLAGFNVVVDKISQNKKTAATPMSAQAEFGNIKIMVSCRNKEEFYVEAENFPPEGNIHDDCVDACSSAFNELNSGNVGEFTSKFNQVKVRENKNTEEW